MIKDKIKVVIWDLDDTLWKGTLAEGDDVQLLENRVAIIKELNKRGIVNAICSKNDPDKAKSKLEEFKKLIESGNIGMIEEMQDVMKGGNK